MPDAGRGARPSISPAIVNSSLPMSCLGGVLASLANWAHVFQATEFNANQWVDEKQVPYTHDTSQPYNWVRVRLVGGKTLFWARMSFRLSDYEFKAKDHDGFGDNWPISYADLAPYYDQVEPIFRVAGRSEGLPQLPDGIFIEDNSPDSKANQQFIAAHEGTGHPKYKNAPVDGSGSAGKFAQSSAARCASHGKPDHRARRRCSGTHR